MRAVRRIVVLIAVFVVSAVIASAQPRGVMTDLAKDIAEVETKIVGLANAMPESAWDWRPGLACARSARSSPTSPPTTTSCRRRSARATPKEVGISGTDYKTVGVYEGRKRSRTEIIAEVQKSFAFLKAAMAAGRPTSSTTPMKIFGTDTTARATWISTTTHLHEHLGQLIAYARSNKVVAAVEQVAGLPRR